MHYALRETIIKTGVVDHFRASRLTLCAVKNKDQIKVRAVAQFQTPNLP